MLATQLLRRTAGLGVRSMHARDITATLIPGDLLISTSAFL